MEHSKKNKYDNLPLGFVAALVLPFIVILLFWYAKYYPNTSLGDFFSVVYSSEMLMKIFSLCALPDIGLFYWFYSKKWDKAVKGVIGAVVFLIVLTIIIKL